MLHYVSLELSSITASFRNPEFQNFHKSFSLPPPTTIIGLAGAAMGLDPLQAQTFFDDNKIFVGISGKAEGKANDLWKYNDFKDGSVILRELLYNNNFRIVFAAENEVIAQTLCAAFQCPVYALSLGPNDSLARVGKEITIGQSSFCKGVPLDCTLVEGDVTAEVFREATRTKGFEFTLNTRDAMTVSLPVRFSYESAYGVRRVQAKKVFSFVQDAKHLAKIEREGIQIGDKFIHLFQL
jgi:CRISPR-associated protein Cas5t